MLSLPLARALESQLTAEQSSTGGNWNSPKKIPHIQRQRRRRERELGFKPESHGPRVLVLTHYVILPTPVDPFVCTKTEGRVGLAVTFYPVGLL